MNFVKKTFAGILICLLLYGCAFFEAAGKKISQYCPGLHIKITSVSIGISGGKETTVIEYPGSYQKDVNTYFTDKANGYTGGNQRRYADLKSSDENLVAEEDSILSKTIDVNKGAKEAKTATVIYNVSTRRIVIVEEKSGE